MLGGFYTFRTGGSVVIEGFWNASTNNPTLVSGVGVAGTSYIVNVAGTTNIDGITDWQIGDIIYFDGTQWRKEDHTCQWDKDANGISYLNGNVGIGAVSEAGTSNIKRLLMKATTADYITLKTTGSEHWIDIAYGAGTFSILWDGNSVLSYSGNGFVFRDSIEANLHEIICDKFLTLNDTDVPSEIANNLYSITGNLTWNGKKVRTSNKYSFTLPGSLVAAAGQLSFASPISGTIGRINAKVGTAPTGDDIDIDINKNGSSILTGNLTIAATETTGYVDPTTTEVAEGDIFIIDIDTVGSTIPGGSDLWIWFEIV